ncbi:hypothetical protein Poli38472_009465 [Pythium oligandrum]|uniref:EF-hand domain-containing protein n=1 Tax=Pythium oligandrum TaxID=41045 RepID=A0A8K1CER6_PYTOL|nr:hypothetical protein Poli38472_009465 [Pythium oligandrum]|eukprot:TMW61972.1 hypothetical protein Poli38472_009465 [Pythium oligandrum]
MPQLEDDGHTYDELDKAMAAMQMDERREAENVSETPCFDALFGRYDIGNGCFGTEHLGSLLLDMGFNCASRVLDRALDEMDPNATGEIAKLTFLEWFKANADEIDLPNTRDGVPSMIRGDATPRNEADENDALTQVTSAMLDAKKQRQLAEADVQLLSNRLVHLRTEDARAQKRIDEANRRAKEIETIKHRNAEHQRQKQRAYEQLQLEIRRMRDTNQLASSSSRARRHQTQNEITSMRSQIVQETRAERQNHLARIQYKRDVEQKQLTERSREIRAQEKHALRRRDFQQKQYERDLIRSAREKLAMEHQQRLQSEKLIQQMEAEEAQLIEKLRISHELQRAAYEHLEFVIQDDDG